ncbi:MAG TPA: hypothetical protein VMX94_13345 [Armatimonadota bacterium]|nr:hypothetical protein [Armatimonadota bacterium]
MVRGFILVVLVVLAGAVLVGCGGSSGLHLEEGKFAEDGGAEVVELQNAVRQMQPGDSWEYEVTGSVSDGKATSEVTGAYTVTVSADTVAAPLGDVTRVVLESATLSYNGGIHPLPNKSYITQDENGTVWTYGGERNSSVYWVDVPSEGRYMSVASPLTQETNWTKYVRLTDGSTFNLAYAAAGVVTITVPAGNLETRKLAGNGTFAGMPSVVQEWWAPQIGAPVQRTVVFTHQGLTFALTAKLTARSR